MKRSLLYIFSMVFILAACRQSGQQDLPADVVRNPISADKGSSLDQLPKFEFLEDTHDFGTVIQGEKVAYSFKFKNIGKSDLLIANVNASCGCTAVSFPKQPIKAGTSEVVTITFNSEGRLGYQHKTIRIVANTQPNVFVLHVKAMIIQPEKN